MPPLTVAEIRAEMPDVTSKYRDYQIERWIAHKGHRRSEVLNTLRNQEINESHLRAILAGRMALGVVATVVKLVKQPRLTFFRL